MRAEIREKEAEVIQLRTGDGSRRSLKKVMKLVQQRTNLIKKLNLRTGFVAAMIDFHNLAVMARRMDIASVNPPEVYEKEAFKYAEIFGDFYIDVSNRYLFCVDCL